LIFDGETAVFVPVVVSAVGVGVADGVVEGSAEVGFFFFVFFFFFFATALPVPSVGPSCSSSFSSLSSSTVVWRIGLVAFDSAVPALSLVSGADPWVTFFLFFFVFLLGCCCYRCFL